jgi:hypothetical protein
MAKTLAILCLIVSVACAMAQKPATPAAKAGDNKDLAATLKLIQNKINEQGEIRYTLVSENPGKGLRIKNKYAMQTGKALVDVSACTISVEAHMFKDGKLQTRGRDTVNVRDVTAMTVKSQTRMVREKTARVGISGWKGTVTPESYSLELRSHGRISGVFFFRTEEAANQVADAVGRTTRLCAGKSMTP